MDSRKIMIFAAVSATFCVVFGAFGAHSLKEHIEADRLQVFETGVRYQFYHSFALLFAGLYIQMNPGFAFKIPVLLFKAGIYIFCGSLYFLAIRGLIGLDSWKWVGAITPLGGVCFILGWLLIALKLYKP